jgi:hypothetical protein
MSYFKYVIKSKENHPSHQTETTNKDKEVIKITLNRHSEFEILVTEI